MSCCKMLAVAGAAVGLLSATANAADLSLMPYKAPPMPVVAEYSGWYLRGNIGMTNQRMGDLTNAVNAGTTVATQFLTFDSSPLFGGGLGYQINNWVRVDGTAEYRGSSHFHGQQVATAGAIILPDDYQASKSEALFLANAYVDLGNFWGVTPFIGAGIGTSRNTISSFVDQGATQANGITILSTTYGKDASQWNFAWAAYAGLSYHVTPGLTLELAYRYVDLGGAHTGATNSFDGVTVVNSTPFVFHNITSQDLMLGLRWNIGEPMGPLMRKG